MVILDQIWNFWKISKKYQKDILMVQKYHHTTFTIKLFLYLAVLISNYLKIYPEVSNLVQKWFN